MLRKIILKTAFYLSLMLLSFFGSRAQKRSFSKNIFLNEAHPKVNSTQMREYSPRHSPYRSFDGTNNNISDRRKSIWGSTDIPLFRELPAMYDSSDPKNAMAGANRPSARQISNVLIDEPVTIFNTRGLSTLTYQWGQFLDHEITLTPTDTTEYVPILLPADESIFTEEIPFFRSEVYTGSDSKTSERQQINLNTAWIDGSVVYGSDATRGRWLRTFKNGKMKTSSGNLLPFNTINGEFTSDIDPGAPDMKNDSGGRVKTFVAGDVRAAENPVLTSLHTLFIREHNRICDKLISEGLRNDEQIYQTARKQVNALIQAITYEEFLPSLGITPRQYTGYSEDTRPDIANTFATAAYRLGHTMVSDDVLLIDNNCAEVPPGELDLVEVFWNPQLVLKNNIDIFIKGSASHDQYQTDTKINSVLRNFLFGDPSSPVRFGIDLGSLNIQRGRDHGLPDYNTVRRFYTGRSARRFSDITSNDTIARSLKNLYGNTNNIDLWIGILSEDHVAGKSVGYTLHEMLKTQFEKLRDGDYYFYLNDPYLSSKMRDEIKNTKFSDVIKRNTSLTNISVNPFFTQECPDNPLASSRSLINSINDPKNSILKLYPNPVRDILNLDFGNLNKFCIVKISAANGLVVKTINMAMTQKNIQINIRDLPNGVYVLNIISGNGKESLKFIKLGD